MLVIGSGGREDAISDAYERSPQVGRIIVSPGNDFMTYGRKIEVITDPDSHLKRRGSILDIADKYKPDIVDIAQDDALAVGSVDLLRQQGYNVFGPTRNAAMIESNKLWSRQFQARHGIPQPSWTYYTDPESAKIKLQGMYLTDPRCVVWIKASGLAAGKGAVKAENIGEAYAAVDRMKEFGEAGRIFLIEGHMPGEEFSGYVVSDGKAWYIFRSAQDNKRVFNNDEGENTGGMGAISPARVTSGIEDRIEEEFVTKAIPSMTEEDRPFQGILYIGGMKLDSEGLGLVEYNARWGDPEAQVVIPGIKTDYVDIVQAVITGNLANLKIEEDNRCRVCVVGASKGYPGDYKTVKGKRINGLEEAMKLEGITVFGAGIKKKDGVFVADGGRLFNIVAEGDNIIQARERAYEAMKMVSIEGDNLHYRTDIGLREEERFRAVA